MQDSADVIFFLKFSFGEKFVFLIFHAHFIRKDDALTKAYNTHPSLPNNMPDKHFGQFTFPCLTCIMNGNMASTKDFCKHVKWDKW